MKLSNIVLYLAWIIKFVKSEKQMVLHVDQQFSTCDLLAYMHKAVC